MRALKKAVKLFGILLTLPVLYLLVGLLLSLIPVNTQQAEANAGEIYLSTNGVHLDVVIPRPLLSPALLQDLEYQSDEAYFAFGWGDKNFYLNTPTWADMTIKNAAAALLWNSPSLIHLTRYQNLREEWVKVPVSTAQITRINVELNHRFAFDSSGKKILLAEPGYYHNDHFYAAAGSYHAFRTCNSWINELFKASGLKTSLWTPYDFGIIWWYE